MSSKMKSGRVAVLYTGGKDSTYTCQLLEEQGHEVACLISIFSQNKESYMLHTASIDVVKLAARAMGFPLLTETTSGEKEKELRDIQRAVKRASESYDFQILASGGIASRYQKDRFDALARSFGLESAAPLWGIDQENYLRKLLTLGYRIMITSVSAGGLGREWLGKEIGEDSLETLLRIAKKYGFNPSFEGGEGETLVLDCPIFKRGRIEILSYKITWNGYFGSLAVKEARLVPKQGNPGLASKAPVQ